MIRIGLTGPSGSGKGYISSLLAKRGVPTLDCDRVVHTLYQDESFVQVLSMAFGVDLSAPDGSVHRKRLGEIVYNAQWYSPLTEAILAFVKSTQKYVTGDVKLKLYKGNIINAGVTSPYSLYDPEIATFDEDEVYNQADAAGFINLYGLPTKVYAKMKAKNQLK